MVDVDILDTRSELAEELTAGAVALIVIGIIIFIIVAGILIWNYHVKNNITLSHIKYYEK